MYVPRALREGESRQTSTENGMGVVCRLDGSFCDVAYVLVRWDLPGEQLPRPRGDGTRVYVIWAFPARPFLVGIIYCSGPMAFSKFESVMPGQKWEGSGVCLKRIIPGTWHRDGHAAALEVWKEGGCLGRFLPSMPLVPVVWVI